MGGTLRKGILRYGVPAGVATSGLALVSTVAFACTAVMGPMTITPSSGPAGTIITTSAQGLKPNAKYALHFARTVSGDCMSFNGVSTIATIKADGSGNWTNVTSVIPSKSSLGVHGVCGMEVLPVKGQTATQHDTFTVT